METEMKKQAEIPKKIPENVVAFTDRREILMWRYYINIMFHVFKESFEDLFKDTLIKKQDILTFKMDTDTMRPAYCLLVDNGTKSILVLLRGTQTVSDLITDLHYSAKPFKGGYCHHGMLTSAQWFDRLLKPYILKALKDYPGYEVKIIGHSLGSGVGVVLTILWAEELSPKCYAYGCPSVVSLDLAEKYSNYITSIINGDDIVPRLSMVTLDELRVRVELFNRENLIHDKFTGWRKIASYVLSGGYWNNDKNDVVDPYVEVVDLSTLDNSKEIALFPCGSVYQIYHENEKVSIFQVKPINYNQIVFTDSCKQDHHLAEYRSILFKYQF
jgi:hypothetical protein